MAVNTTEIGTVYDSLLGTILIQYDNMYDANKIDAETYAGLVGQATTGLIQIAIDSVQKQEAIDKDIESKELQDSLVLRQVTLTEVQISHEGKKSLLTTEQKSSLIRNDEFKDRMTTVEEGLKNAQKVINERQAGKIEKEIEVAERQTAVAEQQNVKQLEKLDSDIAVNARQIAMVEEQRASLVRNDEFKDRMTAVEEGLKNAQKAINERQAGKIEAETESVRDENVRRDLMNKKDREIKDAQKTKTYRDAMLSEQQQLLLANQTAYEAEKTQTLKDNTKANMLIRTIDGGVTEVNGYLGNSLVPPSQLIKVVSEARRDLLEISGIDMNDYLTAEYTFTSTVGTADGVTPRETEFLGRTLSSSGTTDTARVDVIDGDIYLLNGIYYKAIGGTEGVREDVSINTDDLTVTTNWEIV